MITRTLVLVAVALLALAAVAQDIIVDNLDPQFAVLSGTWSTGSYTGGWPGGTGDYRWVAGTGGAADAECEWRPTIATAGWHEVSVWYVQGTNRATNVPFTVHHTGGSTTIAVNQEINGS